MATLAATTAVATLAVGGVVIATRAIPSADPGPPERPTAAVDALAGVAVVQPTDADPADSPSPAPTPTASQAVAVPEEVVTEAASGVLETVSGTQGPTDGDGRVVRYRVRVEQGLSVDGQPADGPTFAEVVHSVLTDGRGWEPIDAVRFARVDSDEYDVDVVLASPATTDSLCAPLGTEGWLSCFNGSATVLNARRWFAGVETYGDDLVGYRRYLVSHEMGHYLGHQHIPCPAPGAVAPVMVQQTKSLQGCQPGPWPSGSP